jgi:tetratricopeptide (TPR) repeat protein
MTTVRIAMPLAAILALCAVSPVLAASTLRGAAVGSTLRGAEAPPPHVRSVALRGAAVASSDALRGAAVTSTLREADAARGELWRRGFSPAIALQSTTPPPAAKRPAQKPATQGAKPAAKTPAPPKPLPETPEFKKVAAEAAAAREANRLDEAIGLYLKAVTIKPDWSEGWFHLGTMSYEFERHEQARDAFRRVLFANPGNALSWALMGLSEFQLKEYDAALDHLLRARTLGIAAEKGVAPVVRYHAAILLSRIGQYDQAIQLLNEFAVEGNDNHRVVEAFGLSALRMPMLPDEVPGTQRDLVMMAGRAQYFSAARLLPAAKQSFEQLVKRYPETPSVHYAYGVFLLGEEPDLGIKHLEEELRISPNDNWAMLQLAFEYIKRSEYESAVAWSRKVVDGDPSNFAARKALGQALLEQGDTAGAIEQLEAGVAIAADSPALRFQLAKAYQKAGRTADADRERKEFVRLDRMVRGMRTGSTSLGGFEPGVEQNQ